MLRSRHWHKSKWQLSSLTMILVLLVGLVLPAHTALAADLDDLRAYAAQMKPFIEDGIDIAQEDAAIIREARAGNRDALCDGRLSANAAELAGLRAQIATIAPPDEAAEIHDHLLASVDGYITAVNAVVDFCQSGRKAGLWRGLAGMATARLRFGNAIVEFDLLLLQEGLEAFQAGYPGSDFEALLQYGAAVGPSYRAWADLMAAEGPAVKAALDGQPEELCNTNIAGDVPAMETIANDLAALTAPVVAADVHRLLTQGAQAWLQGLRASADYCTAQTDWQRAVYLATALADFGLGMTGFAEATAQYTDALQQAWQALW